MPLFFMDHNIYTAATAGSCVRERIHIVIFQRGYYNNSNSDGYIINTGCDYFIIIYKIPTFMYEYIIILYKPLKIKFFLIVIKLQVFTMFPKFYPTCFVIRDFQISIH